MGWGYHILGISASQMNHHRWDFTRHTVPVGAGNQNVYKLSLFSVWYNQTRVKEKLYQVKHICTWELNEDIYIYISIFPLVINLNVKDSFYKSKRVKQRASLLIYRLINRKNCVGRD